MDPALNTQKSKITPPYKPRHLDWTLDEILRMVELYNKHYSMSAIGNDLGKTRNAVAGQIRKTRLKGIHKIDGKRHQWHGQIRTTPLVPVTPKPVKAVKVTATHQPKRIRLKLIESNTAVTFAELEPHHCRFPFGDPRYSDFRFCGCPRVSNKLPYCKEHTSLAGRLYTGAQIDRPQWNGVGARLRTGR